MKTYICTLLPALLLCCHVVAQRVNVEYQGHHLYLKSQVNGKSANLVFDTGAELVYLDSTYLAQSGLSFKHVGSAMIGGAGLEKKKTKIIFGGISVTTGGRKYTPPYVPVVNLKPILGNLADGIFGIQEISEKIITINMQKGEMILSDVLSPAITQGYSRVPIEYKSGRILIPVKVTVNAQMVISGNAMMDMGAGGGIEFTSRTASKHKLGNIKEKKPFHYKHGGIGGESSGYEFAVSDAKFGNLDVDTRIARYSSDKSGAMASDTYVGIIGNKIWEQYSVILALKSKTLYFKKNK